MGINSETRLHGRSVSRGIARGKAVCLYGNRRQFFRVPVEKEDLARETRRFRAAVRLADRYLDKLADAHGAGIPPNSRGILDFHRSVLHDPAFTESVEQTILAEGVNAEWAVKHVMDGYIQRYTGIQDERLRERSKDLEDFTDRIFGALGGGAERLKLEPGAVIVAHELNPSTFIELSASEPAAIVTEQGGWTSHTNILARELGIPAVTGIKGVYQQIHSGDEVHIDGFTGEVVARPDTGSDLSELSTDTRSSESKRAAAKGRFSTLDGREIGILANADFPERYRAAEKEGARGIGLFRSEFFFRRFHDFPGEQEQFEAYRQMAEMAGDGGIRIRTFDVGADELFDRHFAQGKNPALGLRGVRLSLEIPEIFRTQVRALIRAADGTNIDIILPMVSDVLEIRAAREIVAQESASLTAAGFAIGSPRLGAMIEVPAAVFAIDDILHEADVICLGTNDLVQYILAVDRDNEAVSKWFNSLHPAVVNAVRMVFEAAERHDKLCIACGEMAGSPFYVPLLIGLGATALSMNPTSIARVRDVVEGIAYEEAISLVREIGACHTAQETEDVVESYSRSHWKHVRGTKAS